MKDFLNTTIKRALIAIGFGLVATGLSWLVVNVNLKVSYERNVTPTVASYFETCHGDSFNVGAPEIMYKDRGFPVAFSYQQTIPLCGGDRQTVDRTITETENNWPLAGLNAYIYSTAAFVFLMQPAAVRPEQTTEQPPE